MLLVIRVGCGRSENGMLSQRNVGTDASASSGVRWRFLLSERFYLRPVFGTFAKPAPISSW